MSYSYDGESYDTPLTTVLRLSGMGIPPFSIRGASQSLEPISAAADLVRSVNGELLDLSQAQFQKYQSTISCNDQQPPSIDGNWPGKTVVVDCIAELPMPLGHTAAKPVVAGSERTDGDWTFYRPQLTMRIMSYTQTRDEYGDVVSWQMVLEEI